MLLLTRKASRDLAKACVTSRVTAVTLDDQVLVHAACTVPELNAYNRSSLQKMKPTTLTTTTNFVLWFAAFSL